MIEMFHEPEKYRNESLGLFDGFFHTGASNMNRATDTFIFSLRSSSRGGNWNVNIMAFSKCSESQLESREEVFISHG